MERTGYKTIPWQERGAKKPRCASCGTLAMKRVTFSDDFCTLRVTLCGECALLDYEVLYLQRTIEFPGFA